MPTHRQLANAIRALSMDAVQKANSGHPGMPMGMADIAEVLWNEFLNHNPVNPMWINRDRFVLSNGHGCMLQYALLHLTGYELSLADIQQFRQFGSKTPGHPERGDTPGVEATTGPLGQGFAMAVGMAIAERILALQFNQDSIDIIDHYTYVFLGDGCLMEGISHEAASLAGTLGLGKLIAFWDNNGVSIDGNVKGWFTDDTPKRFQSYDWHVVANVDGHDSDAIREAILRAREEKNRPSLICCKTVIGFGAPRLGGTEKCHGSPLGEEEVKAARKQLNWPYPPFDIPEEIYQAWDAKEKGKAKERVWQKKFGAYQKEHPKQAAELQRRIQGELPKDWAEKTKAFVESCCREDKPLATRKASQKCIHFCLTLLPELVGGSADLSGSNGTQAANSRMITRQNFKGNYIHYGVREFAMFAIMNGLALHGEFIPYGGTFLTFIDYGRNAIRLSAIMKQHVVYVLTHDSIGLGEDGPTHQPIEHLAILRMTPNVTVWRPADMLETAIAWQWAIEHKEGPTCLSLTRQDLPQQLHVKQQIEYIKRGAYKLVDCERPDAIIIATGSEVDLAVRAALELTGQGKNICVVSMPSAEVFAQQDEAYRESVLPSTVKTRIAVEAGVSNFWYQYVGCEGKIIGLDSFGKSAPAADIFKAMGFTVENVVNTVHELLGER